MKRDKDDNGKTFELDKLCATFAVTIFLSLCVMMNKVDGGSDKSSHFDFYVLLMKTLWCAAGCFGAASLRLIDVIYDKQNLGILSWEYSHKRPKFEFTFGASCKTTFDNRWREFDFCLFFLAWFCFILAFIYLGIEFTTVRLIVE